MSDAWIGAAVGLFGGAAFSYAVGRATLPRFVLRSRNSLLTARLALAGALVALLPALLLSVAVGGTFGSYWGKRVLIPLGMDAAGATLGFIIGVGLVFALVLVAGTALGVLLSNTLTQYRR